MLRIAIFSTVKNIKFTHFQALSMYKEKYMKRLIGILIMFLAVSTFAFSQFVMEQPVIEFDVNFGSDSFGILRYYGYHINEDDFWEEVITGSVFNNMIGSSKTLILPSFTIIDDNTALDDYIKTIMQINLQSYDDIVSWLLRGSNNVIESSGVQFESLINVLVNNFKKERSVAENTIRNIGNTIMYQRLIDYNERVTEWIVYFRER